jgi:ABC-2 type transport system permease protein
MWAITELSLRKMREAAFYILVLISVVICVMADNADPITGQISQGSLFSFALSGKDIVVPPITIGTCVAMLFCILIAVFYSASEIPSDINNGLIMIVLSKPLGRVQYLAGKYISTMIMSFGVFILIEIALIICNRVLGLGSTPYTFALICRQFLPALMLIPLITITIAFSTVGGSMGAMVITVMYSLFSLVMAVMPLTVSLFPDGMLPGVDMLIGGLRYLFPNYLFYFQDSINNPLLIISLIVYTISVAFIFMFFTMIRLRRMDLSAIH